MRVGWAASGDATLRGLTLSGIPFSFNTATESYTLGGNEGVSLSSTTVTPTVNRPAASYSIDGGAAQHPPQGQPGLRRQYHRHRRNRR